MLWLATYYFVGLPPNGLYTLSWTHGLTPMLFQCYHYEFKNIDSKAIQYLSAYDTNEATLHIS